MSSNCANKWVFTRGTVSQQGMSKESITAKYCLLILQKIESEILIVCLHGKRLTEIYCVLSHRLVDSEI